MSLCGCNDAVRPAQEPLEDGLVHHQEFFLLDHIAMPCQHHPAPETG